MSETSPSGLSDNAAGVMAYITFIPAVIFLLMQPYNSNPYIRFHSWQSIFLSIAAFIIDAAVRFTLAFILTAMPFGSFGMGHAIWLMVELAWILIWLVCVVHAAKGRRYKLPILGDLAERQATG